MLLFFRVNDFWRGGGVLAAAYSGKSTLWTNVGPD